MNHSGFFSYLLASATPAEYYTTVSSNEVISFTDGVKPVSVNSMLIENCGLLPLYIKINSSNFIACIPSGEARRLDEVSANKITVIGAAGQKLRYSGCIE